MKNQMLHGFSEDTTQCGKIFLSGFIGGMFGGIATSFIGLWSLPVYYVLTYYFFRKLEVVSQGYSSAKLAGATFLIVTLWNFVWPVVVLGLLVFGSRDVFQWLNE